MATQYGWWRTFEHFCVPESAPVAVSSDLDRVEAHLRDNTAGYGRSPVIGSDDGAGWRIAFVARKSQLDDIRVARPGQAAKYDAARAGGPRGNRGDVPPVDETSVAPVDLDSSAKVSRVWMEVRRDNNTDDFGEWLYSYRYREDGSARPAFARVEQLQPDDHVLHYWRHAIHGMSVVECAPQVDGDDVRVQLRDFVLFPEPVTLDLLRDHTTSIVDVYHQTRSVRRYQQFPFQIDHPSSSEPTLHGAAVTYLSAVPPALIPAVPLLSAQYVSAVLASEQEDLPELREAVRGPQGRGPADPRLRRAIELHAEDMAIALLDSEGFTEIERIGKPYDLRATGGGHDELHVEVKGSSQAIDTVVLTRNEVIHADDHTTSLVVVDQIEVAITEDGYNCTGGKVRRWDLWVPERNALAPLQFEYQLPDEVVVE
ncbi:DUF3883 domain-containing protein [Gordonia desulfuricans]|uniref:DUF3883 domain-containing protein n=1 Tax=Gordonia desulfuricans TaxID=89051 RepID=A0A7K3LPV6_9ACTN|nr:DUF3883 domain-containing protein [Gordonia desulfuricans]NDK90269.1 DUF3883 domain-containing protein [Gordonia desulfuricans]